MLRSTAFQLLCATALLLALAGCAEQRIRDRAAAESQAGQYEQAVATLRSGAHDHPDSLVLRSALLATQGAGVERLMAQAEASLAQGRLDDAEAAARRVLAIEPQNDRAQALLSQTRTDRDVRRTRTQAEALVAQHKTSAALKLVDEALKTDPRQDDLLVLQRRLLADRRQAEVKAAAAGLAEGRLISLDFRDANLRTVLDVVSRNSGISFILDKDIRPDVRVTVFLRSATVESAIDLITGTYGLSKKLIDSRTLLIYPNTPEKQREHQEQVVKVFYLASGDAKGAAAFLKSMIKVKDAYVDERSNMVALRESPQTIELAERLMALFDSAEPEVMLEVEIIEIRTSRLTELGVQFPETFALTVLPPGTATGLNLANIRGLTRDRIGLTIGGVNVNLKRETGDFQMLANPRVRVRNKEKAKILIGDKVPVVTTTTGTGGFVSDSVSYIDVGLKLEVEPAVYVDNEVAMKIALEVSSLSSQLKTASGTIAYQIGTRNASTLLRLKDGETQLLAGLISNQDQADAQKLPGLGDLPMLGRLFSNHHDENDRTELVLSITPHVVRNLRQPDASESELWVGTEALPRLRPYQGLVVGDEADAPETPAAAKTASLPLPASNAPPAALTTLQWKGPSQVKAGDTFVVTLIGNSPTPLRALPIELAYAKDRLQLVDIGEGELFRQGGAATSFTRSFDAPAGRARAGLLRNGASGASGQGSLIDLHLKALQPGPAELKVLGAQPTGVGGPLPASQTLPVWNIEVLP